MRPKILPQKDQVFQHVMLPSFDVEGNSALVVVAKRTYDFVPGKGCSPAAEQLPLTPADQTFEDGDPLTTSCEFESDFLPYKPLTDIVLNGKAHAPGGKPVRSMLVSLTIGSKTKAIQVFGNRQCRFKEGGAPTWTDPEPFQQMDLRYENAYGGVDVHSREDSGALINPRNPIGKGYVVLNKKKAVEGLPLPNLEEPGNLLTPARLIVGKPDGWQNQPLPQSFGWYAKTSFPRSMYAGVLPEHVSLYETLREAALGHVPDKYMEDYKKLKLPMMNPKFFNGAHMDLQVNGIGKGEAVRLVGMSTEGDISFTLPAAGPVISFDIGDGPKTPSPVLQTVCILPEQKKLFLVWRAALPYPGSERMHELPKLEITVRE